MAIITGGNPDRRKLPRHSRHVARHMLRRLTFRTRAAVLTQQVAALEHDVTRSARSRAAGPAMADVAPGLRVRLGPELRNLLRQLLASRDLKIQRALVREIRHKVAERIAAAERWKRVREAARRKARAARQRTRVWFQGRVRATAARWEAVRDRPSRPRESRASLGTVRVRRPAIAPVPGRSRFGVRTAPRRQRRRGRPRSMTRK